MGRQERPVDPTSGPLEAFAFDLRLLRAKAGEPSYRKLAQRAGVSASALSAAAGGAVLPSRRVTLAYVSACGADINEWSLRWEAVRAQLAEPRTGTQSWRRPSLDLADGRKLALVDAVWQQWVQGCLRSAVEESGLIPPRLTDGSGKPIDMAGLAGLLRGDRRIVMVGPPGAGKSVISLALVRELVSTGVDPRPVVVAWCPESPPSRASTLFSMPTRKVPASSGSSPGTAVDWWCDLIVRRYGTSRVLARSWLDSGQLLPVLDGLDALPQADRAACVSAINVIRPCLITCRTGVYEMLAPALGPHELVSIEPLSLVQVQRHLPIELDPELAELLTIPAFLRLALRMPPRELTDCQAVCAAFVHQRAIGYPSHRVRHWLSWMAQFPVFDLKGLRVDMLSRRRHRWLARVGVVAAITAGALAVFEGAAWLAARWWPEHIHGLAMASAAGLMAAAVCLAAVKVAARLRRTVVLWLLVREGALPRDAKRFLCAAHSAGLLDESREGYRFAHRQVRRYFLGGLPRGTG